MRHTIEIFVAVAVAMAATFALLFITGALPRERGLPSAPTPAPTIVAAPVVAAPVVPKASAPAAPIATKEHRVVPLPRPRVVEHRVVGRRRAIRRRRPSIRFRVRRPASPPASTCVIPHLVPVGCR